MDNQTVITVEKVTNGYVIYRGAGTYACDRPVAVAVDPLGIGAFVIREFQPEKTEQPEAPVTPE